MSSFSDLTGMVGTIGNIVQGYNNFELQKANFDYQRALQQKIFEREDTSYQRQVADLEAAGLNKYAVAGGANAGSVVSTSAPQMNANYNFGNGNAGQIFDAMKSVMQLKSMQVGYKEQLQSLKNSEIQNKLLNENADSKVLANVMKKAEMNYLSGLRGLHFTNEDGRVRIFYDEDATKNGVNTTDLDKVLSERVKNVDLLDKDLQFYDSNKFIEYFGDFLKLGGMLKGLGN